MKALLHITTKQSDAVIAVQKSAVLGEAGNLFIFVQSDSDPLTFEKRFVVTGSSDDEFVEIIQGVFPGDKTVTRGNYQLQYVSAKKAEDVAESTMEITNETEKSDFSGWGLELGLLSSGVIVGLILGRLSKSSR